VRENAFCSGTLAVRRFRPFPLLLFLLPATLLLAQPQVGIEFNGVIVAGNKTTVSLFNPATGVTALVVVGRKFEGRTVTAYNPADQKAGCPSDTVVLTRDSDGQSETIALNGAPIVASQPVAAPASSPEPKRFVLSLPPGAKFVNGQGPVPGRPTNVGEPVFTETLAPDGKVMLREEGLLGYFVMGETGEFQPIYSVRETITAPEKVAAVKSAALDRAAKLKEATLTAQAVSAAPVKTP
jgi:hypothetical protein